MDPSTPALYVALGNIFQREEPFQTSELLDMLVQKYKVLPSLTETTLSNVLDQLVCEGLLQRLVYHLPAIEKEAEKVYYLRPRSHVPLGATEIGNIQQTIKHELGQRPTQDEHQRIQKDIDQLEKEVAQLREKLNNVSNGEGNSHVCMGGCSKPRQRARTLQKEIDMVAEQIYKWERIILVVSDRLGDQPMIDCVVHKQM